MLEINRINAGYEGMQALSDISLHVDKGEVVSLVGSNGAGKTTLLKIVSGFVKVWSGSITFDGVDVLKIPAYKRAELGIAHIPQGRGILGKLSVHENLTMGAYTSRSEKDLEKNIQKSFEMFPRLKERRNQLAGSLSGGEQQMLAIARALMMNPEMIMMDEPSLGLAPIIVENVFEIIADVAQQGVSILLVEQNLIQALSIADRGYVIETGKIVMEGAAKDILDNPRVQAAYLGI